MAVRGPDHPFIARASVCFEAQTGKHLLGLSFTGFDPIAAIVNGRVSRRTICPASAITWHCYQPQARQATNVAAALGHPCDTACVAKIPRVLD
jgi:hypothetical protein